MRNVYIVSCYNPLEQLRNGGQIGAEERYHIESVWTSERKANKEAERLNQMIEWRKDYGYGEFSVTRMFVSK